MRRRRLAPYLPAAAALALLSACASPSRDHLPSLEDYSDGTSTWAEAVLAGWKAGAVPRELLASPVLWSGPLPGDGLQEVASRPPLSLRFYAASGGGNAAPPAGTAAPADVGRRLDAIRSGFASLGRTEATIFDFQRSGADREIVLGLFFSGRGADGALRQEGGRIRATLSPVSGGGWRMSSGSVVAWLSAWTSEPQFEERAAAAGLARPHHAFFPTASRNRPVPGEHLPPGVAVLDYDGDGRPDLFVPGGDGNHLYRNRGDGTFEDVAEKAGIAGQPGEAVGALSFDYDNDGRPDLYVTYLDRPNLLFHNRGDGTFEEVGAKAGVALSDYSTSAAAIDYDRDGLPDLYVLVYGRPTYGPNMAADNAPPNRLFHNNGDGTFTDVTKGSGAGDTGWGLAVECADLDGDGWPDIYVANDFGNHAYLHNDGDGTFTNVAKKAGVLDPGFGMGVAIDDYDGDGRLDLYVSNYSFPMSWFLKDSRYPMPPFPYSLGRPLVWRRLTALSRGSSLFRNLGGNAFERTSDEAGVGDTSWSWGCVFVDADLDGRPDLFVVNGMVTGKNETEREIEFWALMSIEFEKFQKGIPVADFGDDSLWGRLPKRFYRNRDGKHFDEISAVSGLESSANERGVVVVDVNGDGAPDLFATGFLQPPSLWVNRNPSKARALVVSLEGDPSLPGRYRTTRDALGATVTVEANGRSRTQVVAAGYSFLSSGPKELYFGLADAAKADRVVVRWPSGRVTERRGVPAGRLAVREPAAAP
jgi:enediyne biosynthesis protein E4